jgi:hypothetical protein
MRACPNSTGMIAQLHEATAKQTIFVNITTYHEC